METVNPKISTLRITNVYKINHNNFELPTNSFDWRNEIFNLSQPISQGNCGSCWAIAATQILRDRFLIASKNSNRKIPNQLSYKFLLNCASNCVEYRGRLGCLKKCNGGFITPAFEYMKQVGTISGDVQFTTCPKCIDYKKLFRVKNYYQVHFFNHSNFGIVNAHNNLKFNDKSKHQWEQNALNIAKEIYLNGPVTASFNMFSDFRRYWNKQDPNLIYYLGWEIKSPEEHTKIFNGDTIGNVKQVYNENIKFEVGHTISIVGFGETSDGTKYWICRNSWGTSGRLHGYFKIKRGENVCGIESDVNACKPMMELISSKHGYLSKSNNFIIIIIILIIMLLFATFFIINSWQNKIM